MIEDKGIYVDGGWRRASGTERFVVVDPHSEQPFAEISLGDATDAARAVEAAQAALPAWETVPLEERIQCVVAVRDLVERRHEELAALSTHSMGSPYRQALTLGGSLALFDMYVDSIRQLELEYVRDDRFGQALIRRRPVGVVAGIVPWNAPVRSELKKLVPALLCGCTVVLKPAPQTPLAAGVIAEICTEAGIPPGVVNVVPGAAAAGEELVKHPAVRKIAFTGSTATGARIASLAAPSFKRLQLELGGKSAAILLEDVDLAAAMPTLAWSAWVNSGQACMANTRVLAPRERYDEVVDAYVDAAEQHVLGDPMDATTTMGPLVSRAQLDRVTGYVEAGRSEGARLVTGGRRPDHLDTGCYMAPTVFADVDNSMRIAQEEIFGPVTAIIPYDGYDEAVEIANDSQYGLAGGVFGTDEELALSIARRIDTGSVAINGFTLPATAPFGGVKQSGIGREHGPEGYDSFLEYISHMLTPQLAAELSSR